MVNSLEALAMSSSYARSPSSGGSVSRPFLFTTTTCLSAGQSPRIPEILRRSAGSVTSTVAPEFSRRSRTGSGPNAENSGPTTAPALRMPKKATYSSGMRSMNRNTRPPCSTPRLLTTLANLSVCSFIWAKV